MGAPSHILGTRVYVVKCGRFHKVGISSNPPSRLRGLQTANPIKLEIIYEAGPFSREMAFSFEQSIHAEFIDRRVYGEWFNLSGQTIIKYLEKLMKK